MSRKFTQIRGLSQIRRLPRLGRIRGGVKIKKKGGDTRCQHKPEEGCYYCTRPSETPHFIVPAEVSKVYGDQPTALDIMIPTNDITECFPQAYEMYSTGRGLKCTGDGTQALRFDEKSKSMIEVPCPCELLEQKKCFQRGHLSFILPKVSVGGVYTMTTTSFHSIVDINSSLDYVAALIGRFTMVPLKLKREPRETHHDGKKQTHYTCRIELEGNIDFLNALKENTTRILAGPQYILPPPEKENPAYDDGPVYPEEGLEPDAALMPGIPDAAPGTPPAAVIETQKVAPPALPDPGKPVLSEEVILKKISEIASMEDIGAFQKWSEGNKAEIAKLPQEAKDKARVEFVKKREGVEAAEQGKFILGYETTIVSCATVASLDKVMILVGKTVKDGPTKVRLQMLRDQKAQELKKKTA